MSFDCNTWYRLQNIALGTSKALDAFNNASDNGEGLVHMDALAGVSGQFWQFALQSSGSYHLSTLYLGVNKLLGVSVLDNTTTVHLSDVASDAGESWTVSPQMDGTYKLSSDFTGSRYYLDLCGSGQTTPCFETGDSQTQRWNITAIEAIASNNPAYGACYDASSTSLSPSSTSPSPSLESTPPPPPTTTSPQETSFSATTTTPDATVMVSPLPQSATATSIIPFFTTQSIGSASSSLAAAASTTAANPFYGTPSGTLAYTTPSGSVGASLTTSVAHNTTIAVGNGAAGLNPGMGSLPLLALALLGLWRRW